MLPALLFGVILPLVARMNETLGRTIGQLPGAVGVHVFGAVFGAVCVLPFCGPAWVPALAEVPWWAYLGGVLGTGMVVLANTAIGAMGTAGFVAVSVAAQLVTSAAFDHFGLVGSEVHPLSAMRALGIVLLAGGAVMVVKG